MNSLFRAMLKQVSLRKQSVNNFPRIFLGVLSINSFCVAAQPTTHESEVISKIDEFISVAEINSDRDYNIILRENFFNLAKTKKIASAYLGSLVYNSLKIAFEANSVEVNAKPSIENLSLLAEYIDTAFSAEFVDSIKEWAVFTKVLMAPLKHILPEFELFFDEIISITSRDRNEEFFTNHIQALIKLFTGFLSGGGNAGQSIGDVLLPYSSGFNNDAGILNSSFNYNAIPINSGINMSGTNHPSYRPMVLNMPPAEIIYNFPQSIQPASKSNEINLSDAIICRNLFTEDECIAQIKEVLKRKSMAQAKAATTRGYSVPTQSPTFSQLVKENGDQDVCYCSKLLDIERMPRKHPRYDEFGNEETADSEADMRINFGGGDHSSSFSILINNAEINSKNRSVPNRYDYGLDNNMTGDDQIIDLLQKKLNLKVELLTAIVKKISNSTKSVVGKILQIPGLSGNINPSGEYYPSGGVLSPDLLSSITNFGRTFQGGPSVTIPTSVEVPISQLGNYTLLPKNMTSINNVMSEEYDPRHFGNGRLLNRVQHNISDSINELGNTIHSPETSQAVAGVIEAIVDLPVIGPSAVAVKNLGDLVISSATKRLSDNMSQ